MNELLNRLVAAGLTEEQAKIAIDTIMVFAKEKVPPMFAGAINKLFDANK